MTSDTVKRALRELGAERTRQIIYGRYSELEYIGMGKFIDSRQKWCKDKIVIELEKELLNL